MKVYVPTWNNERTIVRCLSGIKDSVPNAEIILVDNFSSDRTVELAKPFATTVIQSKMTLGEARTWICASCLDEWFFMVDSDVYPHKTWATEVLKLRDKLLLEDAKIGAIGCWAKEMPDIEDPKLKLIMCRIADAGVVNQKQLVIQKNYGRFLTTGALYRKNAVAGFNTHVAGMEDYLIGKHMEKNGFNHYSVPIYLHHNQCLDYKNMMRRCRIMGAFWRITGFTHLPNLVVNVFLAPLKVPSGTRQFIFMLYLNYLFGYLNRNYFVKDHQWSKA